MPISLDNSKDIVANTVSIIRGNRTIDLVETIDAVQGFAPETFNSLEKLATAMNNGPSFSTALSTAIGDKADKSTTYTRSATNDLLDAKVDDTEMKDYALKTDVTSSLNTKQATLSTGTASTGSQAILSGTTIKTIVPGTGVSLSSDVNGITVTGIDAHNKTKQQLVFLKTKANSSDVTASLNNKQETLNTGTAVTGSQAILSGTTIKNILPGTGRSMVSGLHNITITGVDAYAKEQVNTKFSDLIGSAPVVLNTLQEIAAVIGDSSTVTTTLINAIATKANTSDTCTKTIVNNDCILTLDNNKRIIATLDNKIKFQAFDNDGTIVSDSWVVLASIEWNTDTNKMTFRVVDDLVVCTTNVITTLNGKANTSDISSLAPKASPALTGTATAAALTVTGDLLVGTTNILTKSNDMANKAASTLTGSTTAEALTVSGDLFIGTTNVLSTLNNKANTSALSSYVLTTAQTSALSSYVLTSALTTALSSYAVKHNATFTGIITIPNLEITGTIGSTSSNLKLRSGVNTLEPQIELSVIGNRYYITNPCFGADKYYNSDYVF
jgi:hypothetical protein